MRFSLLAQHRSYGWIVLLAAAWLCAPLQAAGQIGPVPPQPPRPAAADRAKSDEAKADAKKSDPAGKAKAATEDPVKTYYEKLRAWSLYDTVIWLQDHGLSIVIILLLASTILWIANRLHKRLVALIAGHAPRGNKVEQENRARTLVGVLHNALRTTVIVVAAITILQEIGVPVGPLVGSVAVVGLAVAFGAQSLIKDYFTGFLVLMEQQYMIGDVVKISGITGQVEQITLRITVLRDTEGAVHFIPHGQINTVSNLTHGWSQAVFDLNVASAEHVERVRDLFFELAKQMRDDKTYGPMILNDPQMLGIDSLGDATFMVRFVLRTMPLKRWEVKRELLRRIKDRFQELQIKVMVPA
jgi:small-conductance mechanosensitive channel